MTHHFPLPFLFFLLKRLKVYLWLQRYCKALQKQRSRISLILAFWLYNSLIVYMPGNLGLKSCLVQNKYNNHM